MTRRSCTVIVLSTAFIAACTSAGPPPATAQELATRLADAGITHDELKTLPAPKGKYFRWDEGIALVSDDLWVEIIRIEDQRTFGIARDASGLLLLAEAVAGREFPGKPEIYTRQPFLIVVRQEPTPGGVLATLDRILPAE